MVQGCAPLARLAEPSAHRLVQDEGVKLAEHHVAVLALAVRAVLEVEAALLAASSHLSPVNSKFGPSISSSARTRTAATLTKLFRVAPWFSHIQLLLAR